MTILTKLKKGFGVAAIAGMATISCNAAATSAHAGSWQHELAIYGWFSDISGTAFHGTEFTYEVDDIVDSMEMVFMGGYEGRINKWSVIADMVYLSVGDESDTTVSAGTATADVDLTSWVISGAVGYDLVQSDKGRLAVVAGVRYVDMELESDFSLQGTQVSSSSGSKDLLDGTIGVRGYVDLGKGWFLPYYADVGTGDSDVSYQLFGGVGYQFDWGDVRLGYRYLCIEMDDDKLMEDLTINGPVLGVAFTF